MKTPGFAPPARPSLSLGMVGNCAFSALIDPHGRVVWSCLPRFDGDPVFHALLGGEDAEQGAFAIEIEHLAEARQRYEHNTAVLVTELWDKDGNGLSITDFAPRFLSRGRYFRPTQLVRRVRPLKGAPRIRVSLLPRFDWGRSAPTITSGSNHIRYVGDGQTLRLHTDASISHVLSREPFLLMREHNFIFGPDETLDTGIGDTARHFEQETISYWRNWSRRLALPLEWQEAVIRAAITLKLSLYEDTGAIIAAMTTSIPESPGSERNWDYRYCWLRDAFFVVRALNSLSEVGTMEDYLRWLANVVVGAGGGHIQPLHGIGLERELPERICDTLPGYRGMGPVRVGNQAQEHFQHDVYGNIVLAAAQSFHDKRLLHQAGLAEFEQLEAVGERALLIHDQPDAGMWELRTRARVHTSSVLMCWAACDRLAKIARTLELPGRAELWAARADAMRERILRESWSEKRQAFAESFGGHDLDASVLLMAEVGLIDPKDPRFISTLDALEKHLCDGPFMRRYEAADDFGKPEVAFNICTFWRIDALARIGRVDEARAIFETMLAARNPLGMLSEDTHATTGEMWGNFPQTYSMVGIINAAVRLSASWDTVI
ncbi:glycoside hydrolase family 15 protein [Hydrogenophaga laconesensis]|uniref:GH15 family glucan-1,4-alpha-glucosidase n=1 Tax=Hydrogenophaga laconesensis TaxID=1805971 RepID=A0ABU1V730_9BURK|nr:glycoside hydrolase family 15 protein [Hydrogenophaga laconesensis]MDR7093273.1 GH15 family glucan-1,4-alpha-glucosidase [Hydrogenophaga laconesensis]